MKIQIDAHTLQRANERGASEDEILETLHDGINILAKSNRLGKSKVFKKLFELFFIFTTVGTVDT
jgi:hypothetical protein